MTFFAEPQLSGACGTDAGCDRYPHRQDPADPALTSCTFCHDVFGNPTPNLARLRDPEPFDPPWPTVEDPERPPARRWLAFARTWA